MIDDLVKRLRNGLCMLAQEEAADRIEELEAKLAKAVKGIRTARGFYQVTHIHAALDATLSELTGESHD